MPAPGEGSIGCKLIAGKLYQTISSAYPLKIISPKAVANSPIPNDGDSSQQQQKPLEPAVGYILSYGGGIVHGDQINVRAQVGSGCALILLTQGSTKVYRHRANRPPSYLKNPANDAKLDVEQSYQTVEISVEPNGFICLLPDPVTCFKDALYNQRQIVCLADASSSVVLLDWMTSGRMSRGERWEFAKYFSVNVVELGGKIIVRDALLLEKEGLVRLADVDAFAFLLVLGPAGKGVAGEFMKEQQEMRIRPFRKRESIVWSVSEVDEFGVAGVAVRVAGPTTEDVREWIKCRLALLQNVVGDSAWSMYFNSS
ncbi:hypothetical protein GGI15_000488 [Coemansia interrupta]|uniref:Urease accessory protein UreD n=1 Tax=Coemansia interrupta TaxID=1126814 RepID=A0A9W8HT10_9FUNG|nr:hypothetical protein GGI15_000488 [Coemansia interrupta]